MAYDDQNIFAKILRGELPCEKLWESEGALVFLDIMPRADGHALSIPKTPARNLRDASPAQIAAVMEGVQVVGEAAMRAFGADGLTVQQFNETAGGQEVFHLHFHLLPRHAGASLRPPGVMADREALAEHGRRIRAALAAG